MYEGMDSVLSVVTYSAIVNGFERVMLFSTSFVVFPVNFT